MNAIENQIFKNYWFESGAPTFLINQLKRESRQNEYQILDPEAMSASEESLGNFDLEKTPISALMFQTGYLTIVDYEVIHNRYKLGYPNREVKKSLQVYLLEVFARLEWQVADKIPYLLYTFLEKEEIEQAVDLIRQLFSHVPYQLHIEKEKFYHALLQIACSAAGIKAQSEYSTSHGRIDLVLDLPSKLYVIEIKFNAPAASALAQIESRRYFEKFIPLHKPITLLGLSFHRNPQHFAVSYALKKL